MLALPTASCHPGSSVKRPWGRVRRLLPLGNFFFAITWISLIVSIVFFIVAWVTVVPDALFVNNRVPLNTTGVSVHPHRGRWNPLLTVSIVVAIDTRALRPTGSGRAQVVNPMGGRRVRLSPPVNGSTRPRP